LDWTCSRDRGCSVKRCSARPGPPLPIDGPGQLRRQRKRACCRKAVGGGKTEGEDLIGAEFISEQFPGLISK